MYKYDTTGKQQTQFDQEMLPRATETGSGRDQHAQKATYRSCAQGISTIGTTRPLQSRTHSSANPSHFIAIGSKT